MLHPTNWRQTQSKSVLKTKSKSEMSRQKETKKSVSSLRKALLHTQKIFQ